MVQNDGHDPKWPRHFAGHHAPLPLHTIQESHRANEIRQLRQNRARLERIVIVSAAKDHPQITQICADCGSITTALFDFFPENLRQSVQICGPEELRCEAQSANVRALSERTGISFAEFEIEE